MSFAPSASGACRNAIRCEMAFVKKPVKANNCLVHDPEKKILILKTDDLLLAN